MIPELVARVPRFVILWLDILIIGGILWVYYDKGLFIIRTPETDVTKNRHRGFSWTVGHEKNYIYVYCGIIIIIIIIIIVI